MGSNMNDELTECYNLLGLSPGASSAELKAAHRDLAKVWHPDRFLHDPRLQEKAQEKLKEINEAYEQLRPGKAKRQRPPPASPRERHAPPTPSHFERHAQRIRWQLILAPVLIFAVVFLVTSRSLLRTAEREVPAIGQAPDPAGRPDPERQPGSRVNDSANQLPQGKDRSEARSQREGSDGAATSQVDSAPLRPLPTVTVVIDPTTGLIARSNCPTKTRMTYLSGNEPHQYCNAHPATPAYDVPGPGELRLKSAAKRLASPGKWFGGKAKSDAGDKQDTKSP
jgi:hypothetical protein